MSAPHDGARGDARKRHHDPSGAVNAGTPDAAAGTAPGEASPFRTVPNGAPDEAKDTAAPTADPAAPESDDGPECETCGRSSCPDSDLPGFSEPRACEYAPIFEAMRDAKDCDYGCARDLTNREIRLWVAPAVDAFVAARVDAALAEVEQRIEAWIRHGEQVPADITTYERQIVHHELRALIRDYREDHR